MSIMNISNGSDRRSISFADDENIIIGNAFEDEEGDKNEKRSLLNEAEDNSSNMSSSYGTTTTITATSATNCRPQIQRRRTISATITNSTQSNYKITSLDFEHVINKYSIKAIRKQFMVSNAASRFFGRTKSQQQQRQQRPSIILQKRRMRLLQYSGRTVARWILTIIAGLLTGLTSIFLVTCTGQMIVYRREILHDSIKSELSNMMVFQIFLWSNLLLATASSLMCIAYVPAAAGSGIPEVKAYLNGVRSMQKLAHWPLFLVKIFGTILSVSSGLSLGQEGPLIHIGAIVGASCTKVGGVLSRLLIDSDNNNNSNSSNRNNHRNHQEQRQHSLSFSTWKEKLLNWTMKDLSHFATDAERRDLVCIGASVGFAASFGSPIGGLLFILDDISSYFEKQLLLRMLVANAIGTFCLALKHGDSLSNYSVISMEGGDYATRDLFVNRVQETPLYILIGIGGGVMGGFFSAGMIWMRRHITSKFPVAGQGRSRWQLFEVALVSIISSFVIFYLPTVSWACKPAPTIDIQALKDVNANITAATQAFYAEQERKRFFCPPGQINEMATMMFGSRTNAIKEILTDPGSFQQKTLIGVGLAFYFLTLITFGTAMPSGIFTPVVLSGASLGGAMGNAFQMFDSEISPSTFALLGVAAMLAGIQRSTVSAAVILIEGTGSMEILVPVIIVVVVSRAVAQSINKLGVFEEVIQYKKYPYLPHEHLKRYYDAVQVKDIMSEPPLVTVSPKERVGDLEELLQTSAHHGFPVVETGTLKFLGLVKRNQIVALLEAGIFSRSLISKGEEDLVASEYGSNVASCNEKGDTTQMYHWAYNINDDRYDHILSIPEEEVSESLQIMNIPNLHHNGIAELDDADDEEKSKAEPPERIDSDSQSIAEAVLHEWQMGVRRSSSSKLQTRSSSLLAGESKGVDSFSSILSHANQFATASLNDAGNVVVSCNAEFRNCWVNIEAVANKGTCTVQEFTPVSKAYKLFTALGLRHIVVLGGDSGGEVVGLLTRASFIDQHIEDGSGF